MGVQDTLLLTRSFVLPRASLSSVLSRALRGSTLLARLGFFFALALTAAARCLA